MRTPDQRDEQTLAIATAVSIFAAVLGGAAVVLALFVSVVGLSEELASAIFLTAACAAGALAVGNLVRATRG